LFNVLAMVAEFESDLIRLRTREGMQAAGAKGRLRGKQPKLKSNQAKHLLELYDLGTYSVTELAECSVWDLQLCTEPLSGCGRRCGSPSVHSRSWQISSRHLKPDSSLRLGRQGAVIQVRARWLLAPSTKDPL
jgi:hypothetical protein